MPSLTQECHISRTTYIRTSTCTKVMSIPSHKLLEASQPFANHQIDRFVANYRVN